MYRRLSSLRNLVSGFWFLVLCNLRHLWMSRAFKGIKRGRGWTHPQMTQITQNQTRTRNQKPETNSRRLDKSTVRLLFRCSPLALRTIANVDGTAHLRRRFDNCFVLHLVLLAVITRFKSKSCLVLFD